MIYDCFMFYNEVELLQLRMRELYDAVDYFVVVEASNKHRDGSPRDSVYGKNLRKFSKFKDKIKYFAVTLEKDSPYGRENEHRNKIYDCLLELDPEYLDMILVSDLDEIPNKEKFDEVSRLLEMGEPVVYFNQMYFVYFYNCFSGKNVTGTAAVHFNTLKQLHAVNGFGPQTLRNNKDYRTFVNDGGWHFSYMGGADKIRLKSESIFDGNPASKEFFEDQISDALLTKRSPYSTEPLQFINPSVKEAPIESIDLRAGHNHANSGFTCLLPSEIVKNNRKYEKFFHRE